MESQLNPEPVKKEIKLDFKEAKYATGRRKKSIAKVGLKKGSGNIYINEKTNSTITVYSTFFFLPCSWFY